MNAMNVDDIHTHKDYYNDVTTYVKNLRSDILLSGEYKRELLDTQQHPNKFISAGIHPWDIALFPDAEKATKSIIHIIETDLITSPKFFAIGECGLDKCINTNFFLQQDIFYQQIDLSIKYNKLMIIHAVRSYNEIIKIRKDRKIQQTWIIHGYTGNVITAKQLVETGAIISLNKNKIDTNKTLLLQEAIGRDNVLLETD